MKRSAIFAYTGLLLLLACPGGETTLPTPREINTQALLEAKKRGLPGTLEFTVALRRAEARIVGDQRLASWPVRDIEREPVYQRNLSGALEGNFDTRIFHGTPVPKAETAYSSVVAVLNLSGEPTCSGFAISATKIITAKHCLPKAEQVQQGNDVSTNLVYDVIGTAEFGSADIGMLFLKGNGIAATAFFSRAIASDIDGSKQLTAMGFGADENGIRGAKAFCDVTIASYHCDGANDPGTYGCTATQEMVADDKVNHGDTCEADSGGPAFIEKSGMKQVAAIIRQGVKGRDCIDGSIYVRLDSAEVDKWIAGAVATPRPPRRRL